MRDNKFWRMTAVVACALIFYVGHGLHRSHSDAPPSLVNSAHAGGVAIDTTTASSGRTRVYTSNETGTVLYIWDAPTTGEGIPRYVATIGVPKDNWLPPSHK
jgi:hypothetical protein